MFETKTQDAFTEEPTEETTSNNDVVVTLAIAGLVVAATAGFAVFMKHHFAKKTEDKFWTEAIHPITDL